MNHSFRASETVIDPHVEQRPGLRMRKKRPYYLERTRKFILDVLLCRGDLVQEEDDSKPVSYSELFRFASFHDKICIILGSVFACVGGAVQPMVLVFGGMITSVFLKDRDNIENKELWEDVRVWLILLGAGGLLALISTYLQSWLLQRGCCDMINTLRRQFLAAVLRQDAIWFGENNSGAITSLLNTNIERIEDGLSDKLGALLRGFSMFISSIAVCLFINWQLTLIAVTMGPISAWTLGLLGKVVSKFAIQMQDATTEAAIVVEESIMNVRTVAACNAQEHMVEKYENALEELVRPALKYSFWVGFFEGLSFAQIYLIMGITFWVGIYGYFNGWVVRGGDTILVVNTISLTGYYLGLLGPHMMAILKARIAAALIYSTIDRKPRENFHPDEGIILKKPRGDIEVQDVVFKYPSRDGLILKGISWTVKTGESIALVGRSGCGKSTSIGLLTRLYDVISGKIKIDGIPIQKINICSLRQIIGIVEQEPCLFNGTVLENITLGREGITEKDALRAAQIARADEFINQLQHKYDTILGVGGVTLSGGQKQRLAIARAIATDPKILLLDEATSALDTESERIVQAALNRAAEGRTTVIIAHRLSTLKDVSRIYVLDNGVVVEEGTHDGLIAKGGIYCGLAKAQEINQAGQVNEEEFGLSNDMRQSLRQSKRASKRRVSLASGESTESEKMDSQGQKGNGLWLLYSNIGGNVGKVLLALLCAIIRGSEMPLLAVMCTLAFKAVQTENKDHYVYNGFIVFLVATGSGLLYWVSQIGEYTFAGWSAEKIVAKLRIRALRSLLYRPLASFDQPHSSPAACVAKIAQHAPNCIPAFDYHMALNITNGAAVVVGLILAFAYSWQLGLLGVGLCVTLFFLALINIKVANTARKRKELEDQSGEYSIEIVEQARTIQLLTVEKHFLKKFSDQLAKSVSYDRRIGFVNALNLALTQSFVFFCDLCGYALATHLIYSGTASVETIFLAFMGSQISGWSVMYGAPFFPDIVKASSSARQLFKLIDDEKNLKEALEGGEKTEISGTVNVAKVDFAYPVRPDVLVSKNLNIFAKKGQSIALVGASGCGKSTIIALLERFYTADRGEVLIDEKNVKCMNLKHLRSNVALVSQEPVLFKGSIIENITMGAGDIPLEKVIEACRTANAAKFVEAFPGGYETDVGEKGRSLSGGQKQRIAIARALVRNPKIILLDEATSALDTESEEIVQKALNDASLGRTSITIAHRLSSIQNCDRIFVIEKGTVVESGCHSDLLHLDGRYAKLVEAQQLNAK